MIAFAANSIIGRAALRSQNEVDLIDPASYTAIRIAAGAIVLLLIQWFRFGSNLFGVSNSKNANASGFARFLLSPLMLVIYAAGFSFAYIGLDTASGTLILFAFVQITMLSIGLLAKEIPRPVEIAGLTIASGGLVYLVLPNLQTPLLKESILMAVAGVAWGSYSVLGKKSLDPISSTATNFAIGTLMVFCLPFFFRDQISLSGYGVFLAVMSGGIASGLGYVLWYLVLPLLRSAQAAAVQLSVPIFAALGGVLLVGDELNTRIVVAGALILFGIGLTVKWKKPVTSESQIKTDS